MVINRTNHTELAPYFKVKSLPDLQWVAELIAWASYQIRKIAGRACAGNAGSVFHREPLVSDSGMHHVTCVMHVTWCMSGSLTRGDGENVPDIPGACATCDFTHLAIGPWLGTRLVGRLLSNRRHPPLVGWCQRYIPLYSDVDWRLTHYPLISPYGIIKIRGPKIFKYKQFHGQCTDH